jgi:hypothetical protein
VKRRKLPGSYWRHPDVRQEQYFFALVKECLDNGMLSQDLLRHHIEQNHVRHDAFEIASSVPKVDDILGSLQARAA